jgi:hypothetical protein
MLIFIIFYTHDRTCLLEENHRKDLYTMTYATLFEQIRQHIVLY